MCKFLSSLIIFFVAVHTYGQDDIDFNHKRIYKGLEKYWGYEQSTVREISIPDSIKQQSNIQGKYFIVSDAKKAGNISYMYIGRVNSCRAGGCSISSDTNMSYETEYFDYYILFDSACTVNLVRVYNYAATHGQEVAAKGWLKQFNGFDGTGTLEVGKNVDAISGATISVYEITLDVQRKTTLLKRLVRE